MPKSDIPLPKSQYERERERWPEVARTAVMMLGRPPVTYSQARPPTFVGLRSYPPFPTNLPHPPRNKKARHPLHNIGRRRLVRDFAKIPLQKHCQTQPSIFRRTAEHHNGGSCNL